MENLLTFLSGKKGTIASLIGIVNGYLFAKGVYSETDMYFIGAVSVVLFGVASYQTNKVLNSK